MFPLQNLAPKELVTSGKKMPRKQLPSLSSDPDIAIIIIYKDLQWSVMSYKYY